MLSEFLQVTAYMEGELIETNGFWLVLIKTGEKKLCG
jgi:hypothetical protein